MSDHWQSCLLSPGSTVQDAIQSLDRSGLQIVIVVASDGVLVGTITDGDIRRGMLAGVQLADPISAIVHERPMVALPDMTRADALRLMQVNRISQLPVVDDHRRVIALHVWSELQTPEKRSNPLVVMAGGRGVRLRPHTENCPKPMLPVGDRPMLEHIIDRARADGFGRFVLAINYLGHIIENHFGDGSRWGVEIEYLREDQPLGTGGALSLLDPRPDETFVVTNGDVLTDIRYSEILDFHRKHQAAATMAVRVHEFQNPFGVVHLDGMDIAAFEEKPITRSHVNAGIYAIEPGALNQLAVGCHCDMPTLFERLKQAAARTIAFPMYEPWLDVGRPADLERARDLHGSGM